MRKTLAVGLASTCLLLAACHTKPTTPAPSVNAIVATVSNTDTNVAGHDHSQNATQAPSENVTNTNKSPPISPSLPSSSRNTPSSTHPSSPTGKVIIIDAGHGGADSGAIGIGGVMEKDLTLEYALAVKNVLESHGYEVHLTRSSDTARKPETSDVEQEIRARTSLSKQYHASLYVSIHMNWYSDASASGTETFFNNTNHREGMENPFPDDSMLLAQTLEAYITNAIHTKNRGSEDDELYNLITNTVPASLVEVGFISNQGDLNKILDPNVKAAFADAFANAIDAYFKKLH